jgi:hypothetical protein
MADERDEAGEEGRPGLVTFLKGIEAQEYYRGMCATVGVKPNNSFLKVLLGEVSRIDFSNCYFGDRGILSIAPTLARIPVIQLDFSGTALSFEDTGCLCSHLVHHPTVSSLDLRRVVISVPSARRWLALASQNRRITTFLLDDAAPKSLLIQRQCLANAKVCVYASRCVVCNQSMIHLDQQNIELHLIQRFIEQLGEARQSTLHPAEFRSVFLSLITVCQANDGILFLCSMDCVESLVADLLQTLRFVGDQVLHKGMMQQGHPKNILLNRVAKEVCSTSTANPTKGSIEKVRCDLCNQVPPTTLMGAPLSALLEQLKRDLSVPSANLRPSAFLRLIHAFEKKSNVQVCGKKCCRAFVRHCILGFGGANLSRPTADVQAVTVPLTPTIPLDDAFAVVDFRRSYIFNPLEEPISPACVVASLVSDMDDELIDPVFVTAATRSVGNLGDGTFGMELRTALAAVTRIGAIPQALCPFTQENLSAGLHWKAWEALPDFPKIRRAAIGHRKPRFVTISGPTDSIFDNIKLTLWHFRHIRRAIGTTVKWKPEWFRSPKGVIPLEMFRGGACVAVKVVGFCIIDHIERLIVQTPFGDSTGNKGYFYFSRMTANRSFRYGAYLLLDAERPGIGGQGGFQTERFVPPPHPSLSVLSASADVHDLLRFLANLDGRTAGKQNIARLKGALKQLPSSALFSFVGPYHVPPPAQYDLQRALHFYYREHAVSQLAFYWTHVADSSFLHWISTMVREHMDISSGNRKKTLESVVKRRGTIQSPLEHSRKSISVIPFWETTRAADRVESDDERSESQKAQPPPAPQPPAEKRSAKSLRPNPKSAQDDAIAKQQQMIDIQQKLTAELHQTLVDEVKITNKRNKEQREQELFRLQRQSPFSWTPSAPRKMLEPPTKLSTLIETDSLYLELRDDRWHCATLWLGPTESSTVAMFFIGKYFCRYDFELGVVVQPLTPMIEDRVFRGFPFSSGFDALLPSPMNPSQCWFFRGGKVLLWDFPKGSCLETLTEVSIHPSFHLLKPWVARGPFSILPTWSASGVSGSVFRFGAADGSDIFVDVLRGEIVEGKDYFTVTTDDEATAFLVTPANHNHTPHKSDVHLFTQQGTYHCKGAGAFEESLPAPERGALADSPFASLPAVFHPKRRLQRTLAALQNQIPTSRLIGLSTFVPGVDLTADVTAQLNFANSNGDNAALLLTPPSNDYTGLELPPLNEPHVIQFRFHAAPMRFVALQLVLDFSKTPNRRRKAPVRILIENSLDGVSYTTLSQSIVRFSVGDVFWEATHFASYWRLTILDAPINLILQRALWLQGHWVTASKLYSPEHLFDIGRTPASVRLFAAATFQEPARLLDNVSRGPVFRVPGKADRWREPHCWLPLLPPRRSSLVFVGECFVEWDQGTVVGGKVNRLAEHPAFIDLPFPFNSGIDAAFYPDPQSNANVVLLRSNRVIEWNLEEGKAEGKELPILESFWFSGFPAHLAHSIDAVVNLFGRPGQVLVFSGSQVLRWNVYLRSVMDGPMDRKLMESVSSSTLDSEAAILTAAVSPWHPEVLYLFQGDSVVKLVSTADRRKRSEENLGIVSQSKMFHKLSWFLRWSVEHTSTSLSIDFSDSHFLFVGITLRSVCGHNPNTEWLVECSDDFSYWRKAAIHHQIASTSSCSWSPMEIDCRGFRYWRLTAIRVDCDEFVDYEQLLFHVLPSVPYTVPALAIGGTATPALSGTGSSDSNTKGAFTHHTEVAFGLKTEDGCAGSLLFDYGSDSAPELTELSFDHADPLMKPPSALWAVAVSDDNHQWTVVGQWRSRSSHTHFAWCPLYPHRYWKLELLSSDSNEAIVFKDISFREYSGPSVEGVAPQSSIVDALACLLRDNRSKSTLSLHANVGEVLQVDFKADPQPVIGMSLVADVDTFDFNTTFAIEYSDSGAANDWVFVGTVVVCDDIGMSAWENEGRHRFWRIRVTRHYGPKYVVLKHLGLMVCGPMFYQLQRNPPAASGSDTFCREDGQSMPFIYVRATLPPLMSWEIQSSDGVVDSWRSVAVLQNNKNVEDSVAIGWSPSVGPKRFWRLAPVLLGLETVQPLVSPTSVQWGTFRTLVHEYSNLPSTESALKFSRLGISLLGYELSPKNKNIWLLHADVPSEVIVTSTTSAEPEKENPTPPAVVYCFPSAATFTGVRIAFAGASAGALQWEVALSHDGACYRMLKVGRVDSTISSHVMLTWPMTSAIHWRVRCLSLKAHAIHSIRWIHAIPRAFDGDGMPQPTPSVAELFFSAQTEAWIRVNVEQEQQLIRSCAKASSFLSGFVEDVEQLDGTDKSILAMEKQKKSMQRTVVRALKESNGQRARMPGTATGAIDVSTLFESLGSAAAKDLMKIFESSVFLSEFRLIKETGSNWLLPKVEYRGVLVQPLFGFVGCRAAFSCRYLMYDNSSGRDSILGEQSQVADATMLDPTNRFVCSLFGFSNASTQWQAHVTFTAIAPLLCLLGCEGLPFHFIQSSSCISFPAERPFICPDGNPFECSSSLVLERGTNILFRLPLSKCEAPLFSVLQCFLRRSVLKQPTPIVLHHSAEATRVRFVSDIKPSLGIPGLIATSCHFEFLASFPRRPEGLGSGPTQGPSIDQQPVSIEKLTFYCIKAMWSFAPELPRWEVTVRGEISQRSPIAVVTMSSSSHPVPWPNPFGLGHHAEVMDFTLKVECLVASNTLIPTAAVFEGHVYLPGLDPVPIKAWLTSLEGGAGWVSNRVQLGFHCSPIPALLQCSRVMTGNSLIPIPPFLSAFPLYLSLPLTLGRATSTGVGEGTATLFGQVGTVVATISERAFSVLGYIPSVTIGDLEIHGRDSRVTFEMRVSQRFSLQLDGQYNLSQSTRIPVRLEIEADGSASCRGRQGIVDMVVRSEDPFFSKSAMISFSLELGPFEKRFREKIMSAPIVTSICALDIPVPFTLQSVTVAEMPLRASLELNMSFTGVLLGYGFDVLVILPFDEESSFIDSVSELAVSAILEQCSDALWTALKDFGESAIEIDQEELADSAFDSLEAPSRRHTCPVGSFLAAWAQKEDELVDHLLADAIDST